MKKPSEELFRERCKFQVSLRYELFYSLNALLDPKSRIHPAWKTATLKGLGGEFSKQVAKIGSSWEIWPVIASLLPGSLSHPDFPEVIEAVRRLPTTVFQEKILLGLIHIESVVNALLCKQISLKTALGKVPAAKQEWISHIGLYPYDSGSAQVVALESLLEDPEEFRDLVLNILELYWKKSFRVTWELLEPQLRRSREERERLFLSSSFSEFARQALLRIEIDESKGRIKAIRGGYQIPYNDVDACFLLPSAFNDRRFWSAFTENDSTTVYFPYFDPSLSLDLQLAKDRHNDRSKLINPALDPALIFKALGDSTRFAIATILARTPTSSVELAKILSVSKPTISHHVHLLREAGLIVETYANGSVELQLNRSVLEQLSELTVNKLFDAAQPMNLIRTRGGAGKVSI